MLSRWLFRSFVSCAQAAVIAAPLLAAEPRLVVPPAPLPIQLAADYQSFSPAPAMPGGSYVPAPSSSGSGYYMQQGSGAGSIYGTPGGYEARIGSPYHYYDPRGGQYSMTGNPYHDHWGPGFHRDNLHGHYRFPYYNYRAPWYYPGRAVYNRDTNFAW